MNMATVLPIEKHGMPGEDRTKVIFSLFLLLWAGIMLMPPIYISDAAGQLQGGMPFFAAVAQALGYTMRFAPFASNTLFVNAFIANMEGEESSAPILLLGDGIKPAVSATNQSEAALMLPGPNNTSETGDTVVKCALKLPTGRAYILRLDDVQAFAWASVVEKIVAETEKRNMSIVLGVMPAENFASDTRMVEYLVSKVKEPRIEIAQHGLEHSPAEFRDLTGNETLAKAADGRRRLRETIGAVPVTFTPPYNAYGEPIRAVSGAGFAILSGKEGENRFDGSLYYLGYTDATNAYSANESDGTHALAGTSTLLRNCKTAMDRTNICVIMIHPQDYVGSDRTTLDAQKFAEFAALLDGLADTGAKSITFRDLLSCENGPFQGWDPAFFEERERKRKEAEELALRYNTGAIWGGGMVETALDSFGSIFGSK